MYSLEILKVAYTSIIANKVRSFLTVLGIIIGISSVIAMVSVGQGAQEQILEQLEGLGPNAIIIVPVSNFAGPTGGQSSFASFLNNRLDRNVLKRLENKVTFREISAISPQISENFEVAVRSRESTYSVFGVVPDYTKVYGIEIDKGRFISEKDDNKLKRVTVLGPDAVEELFGENDPIGKNIKIDGSNYIVIGTVMPQAGNLDDRVYVPLNTASGVLIGDRDFSQIVVRVEDEDLVDSVATKLETELLDFYKETNVEDASFSVITSKEILQLVGTVTGVFTTLLTSIAAISLLVGGIGIMNIMLVSVSERTREIGLRKAVGAKQNSILGQFLMEALVLTVFGGLLGIVLGIGFAALVGALSGIPVVFTVESVVLATSVSAAIGLIFGFYPAYVAARLNPIDALRYE